MAYGIEREPYLELTCSSCGALYSAGDGDCPSCGSADVSYDRAEVARYMRELEEAVERERANGGWV